MDPVDGATVIQGTSLEWRRWAPSEAAGPTWVFLHEGLGAARTWKDFPARVAQATGRPALAYSRAGYGASDPVELPRPLSYMQDEARETLPSLLEALGLDDVVLFGHSDGGSVALVYAGTAHGRARVRGVAVEAPHVICEDISVRAIERTRQAYLDTDLRARLARYHAHVDVAFWGWNRAWLDPAFRDWSLVPDLAAVRAPALLVQCADDPYGTLAQLEIIAREVAGPTETVVYPAGGHAPHRVETDDLVARLAAFGDSLPDPGAPGRP